MALTSLTYCYYHPHFFSAECSRTSTILLAPRNSIFLNPQISLALPKSYGKRSKTSAFHVVACVSKNRDAPVCVQDGGVPAINDNNNSGSPSTSFLSVLCPLLKIFSGGDPSQERNDTLEVTTSYLSTLARFAWGSKAQVENSSGQEITRADLPMPIQLFEFEACPFCRRVREAMTELDLSAEVYPCPKGSVRHREMVRSLGGKEQFPFLVDPNTGIQMYESGDVVKYLFSQYGKGRGPSTGLLESTLITGWVPTILRAGRGMMLWEKARLDPPSMKLELFSYENNPYARIVREALCELELPYILRNVGEGSQRAESHIEVPYIIDPNTGTQLGDYKKILEYLFNTYSAAATS